MILRTCNADMTSRGGFKWPESGPVEAPDWKPTQECGNGLHGWLWGCGDWSLKIGDSTRKWIVLETSAKGIINLDGKVKFQSANVLFVTGKWNEAMAFLRGRSGLQYESIATGNYGHASATGDCGHASATGDYGEASATGNYGWAISNHGTAKAGKDGILTIRYKNAAGKYRAMVGYVGENGIKPNVVYSVDKNGNFQEAI
ncbi:MAG: hypothetical protein EB034_08460 [Verrucomicrobia bacterium]|nr:hypothetical protein [Verrucomicrobiota bacterium]